MRLAAAAVLFAVALMPAKAQPLTDPGVERARQALKPDADRGDPVAQNNLGTLYEIDGPTQDLKQAAAWYAKAAAQGYAVAQHNLAVMYEQGRGVAADLPAAAALFRRAADQGYAPGQYLTGLGYRHGSGVARDPVAALTWFTLAAEQGYAPAVRQRDELGAGLPPADAERAAAAAKAWRPARN